MTAQNRRNVYLPDPVWLIVEDEAKQEAKRVAKDRPNISGTLAKIVVEWSELKRIRSIDQLPEPA